MSKALDKVHELLKQKFPDANYVSVSIDSNGMDTNVHYETGKENVIPINTLSKGPNYINVTVKEEE